jgi:hypothetical protein
MNHKDRNWLFHISNVGHNFVSSPPGDEAHTFVKREINWTSDPIMLNIITLYFTVL